MSKHLTLRSGNPALRSSIFKKQSVNASLGVMTVSGTVNKTGISLLLLILSAGYSWGNPAMHGMVLPALIIGVVLAIATVIKPTIGHITVPMYAVVEGVVLGVISMLADALDHPNPLLYDKKKKGWHLQIRFVPLHQYRLQQGY